MGYEDVAQRSQHTRDHFLHCVIATLEGGQQSPFKQCNLSECSGPMPFPNVDRIHRENIHRNVSIVKCNWAQLMITHIDLLTSKDPCPIVEVCFSNGSPVNCVPMCGRPKNLYHIVPVFLLFLNCWNAVLWHFLWLGCMRNGSITLFVIWWNIVEKNCFFLI